MDLWISSSMMTTKMLFLNLFVVGLSINVILVNGQQPKPTAIEADVNQLEMRVPGATVTFKVTNESDIFSKNSTHVDQGFITEAITLSVKNKFDVSMYLIGGGKEQTL